MVLTGTGYLSAGHRCPLGLRGFRRGPHGGTLPRRERGPAGPPWLYLASRFLRFRSGQQAVECS